MQITFQEIINIRLALEQIAIPSETIREAIVKLDTIIGNFVAGIGSQNSSDATQPSNIILPN